jgi:Asp-tRNA(Asn)/Glu-tRNA(Gln) amidotransferase A subunit family amidase
MFRQSRRKNGIVKSTAWLRVGALKTPEINATFGEWQQLKPNAAAREVRRRIEANLPAEQRKAVVASLLEADALRASFASAGLGAPLRGVPYLLKDLFDVAGLPTFAGSSFLPEVRPSAGRDSALVRELASAGSVMAGKANHFEFAWGLTGENAHYVVNAD